MARIFYGRLNETRNTTLEDAKVGDIINLDGNLYIVTNEYNGRSGCRTVIDISPGCFGELEHFNEATDIEILEDAEIAIKY